MELIEGVVRNYQWGSLTAIPELLGRPGTGEPWAEWWLGAHPAAPAMVGARAEPLDRLIAADPLTALGPAVAARYGRLPFLLKVLAAAEPLSLQVHPGAADAEAGFEREEAMGIARDGPQRMFRDRSAKPELLCALSTFEALCGFRDPPRTAALLDTLDTSVLDPLRARLDTRSGAPMRGLLEWLLGLDPTAAAALAESATEVCAVSRADDEWSGVRSAVAALGAHYRGDIAVVVALLLNHVVLAAGEALFVDGGCLHAYLGGTAVELMADSDNVVRGGLTSKHVDAATLMEIVDATPAPVPIQIPERTADAVVYRPPVAEFCLWRLDVDGPLSLEAAPAVLLCIEGCVDANGIKLDRGTAAFSGADETHLVLQGQGTVFCATVGNHR